LAPAVALGALAEEARWKLKAQTVECGLISAAGTVTTDHTNAVDVFLLHRRCTPLTGGFL
jgi:hypothetical protein